MKVFLPFILIFITACDVSADKTPLAFSAGALPVEETPPPVAIEKITYRMVHEKVLQPRCIGCHSEAGGDRGGVNLENYENVAGVINAIEVEIKNGTMPRPVSRPLTAEQKDLILKWIADGGPEN